ncbi:MAG: type II toxin-antitoxin system Phd/YefM family antitoxin [Beijerinckiaceae bacterium]|nr:type II toxin-antitoxin system Phd/YefM family antitoxin [Beijerinckiaceae bacterium]
MRYSTQVRPVSYLKANVAEVLADVHQTREPVLITQNGQAKAVLVDVVSYEQTQETLALLKLLALGQREIEQGDTVDAIAAIAELAAGLAPSA